jgi:hypothetical protein
MKDSDQRALSIHSARWRPRMMATTSTSVLVRLQGQLLLRLKRILTRRPEGQWKDKLGMLHDQSASSWACRFRPSSHPQVSANNRSCIGRCSPKAAQAKSVQQREFKKPSARSWARLSPILFRNLYRKGFVCVVTWKSNTNQRTLAGLPAVRSRARTSGAEARGWLCGTS